MKKNFIWTFNETALGEGLRGNFSLEYHVPSSSMTVVPSELIDAPVWVVLKKGTQSFLYAILTPTEIAEYEEGKYKGDYTIQCAPFASIRFLPRHESQEPWLMSSQFNDGLFEISDSQIAEIREKVTNNERIGFSTPTRKVIDAVPRTNLDEIQHSTADQMLKTLRSTALGDVSRMHSLPNSISGLGVVTFTILKTSHPNADENRILKIISSLDLAGSLFKEAPTEIGRGVDFPPIVDTFLVEIDPDKIQPRKFVASSAITQDWIDKTNDAEEAHETILRDLVVHLKAKGFATYKSQSFDLLAKKGSQEYLWEVKSANRDNSVSQGEKGVIQLLRYSSAFGKKEGVSFNLLLQDTKQNKVQKYLDSMNGKIGSKLWLYDVEQDWPNRIKDCDGVASPF